LKGYGFPLGLVDTLEVLNSAADGFTVGRGGDDEVFHAKEKGGFDTG
jgi:hypothetical protein